MLSSVAVVECHGYRQGHNKSDLVDLHTDTTTSYHRWFHSGRVDPLGVTDCLRYCSLHMLQRRP